MKIWELDVIGVVDARVIDETVDGVEGHTGAPLSASGPATAVVVVVLVVGAAAPVRRGKFLGWLVSILH